MLIRGIHFHSDFQTNLPKTRGFCTSLKSGKPRSEIMNPTQTSKINISPTFLTAYHNLLVWIVVEQKIIQIQNTNK